MTWRPVVSTVAVFGLYALVATVTISLLELGSGVVPVQALYLYAPTLTLAALTTALVLVPSRASVRSKRVRAVIGIVIVVIITGRFFRFAYEQGFVAAERYAGQIAAEVAAVHERTGMWPATTSELPTKLTAPRSLFPSVCDRSVCSNVAGFFINYELRSGRPRLTVSRREHGAIWNFETNRWTSPS
ncbi:MAG: hypothetical protein QOK37_2233 [Thermoanaerobaculia bacterium]|jgi:hypothetical protein|nr:hypothetical protein [Thermoanaerobaculia bacterium]